MSEISTDQLKNQIRIILKDADLTVLSAKKVRLELEKELGCKLLSRKKEIDTIVMDFINRQEKDDSSSEEEDDEPQSRKRTSQSNNKKSTPVKKKRKASDSGDESESASVKSEASDHKSAKKSAPAKKKRGGRKRGSGSDNDSDSDYVKPKPAPRKAASGRAKGTGFTRSIALSPELAALMGAESLPRHEVVKKMWSIIKEKNLYCPKNKQFAICDEALYKVMGVKRFRTFGMLKYLKSHFVD